MGLARTLRFITTHPMTREQPLAAVARYVKWQVQSRLQDEVVHDWIGGAKLAVRRGMTGATGNIYCGLHEFVDMSFVLHVLRPGDLFIDAGANVGSYTVLAAAVAGADVVAFEPDPGTVRALRRNVELNRVAARVDVRECALGAESGIADFTVGRDTTNRIAQPSDTGTRRVPLTTLDAVLDGRPPTLIKLDVEGYEPEVLAGAGKSLAAASLLAVIAEGSGSGTVDVLSGFGFARAYYDPPARRLLDSPRWRHGHTNELFVRNRAEIDARLAAGSPAGA